MPVRESELALVSGLEALVGDAAGAAGVVVVVGAAEDEDEAVAAGVGAV